MTSKPSESIFDLSVYFFRKLIAFSPLVLDTNNLCTTLIFHSLLFLPFQLDTSSLTLSLPNETSLPTRSSPRAQCFLRYLTPTSLSFRVSARAVLHLL